MYQKYCKKTSKMLFENKTLYKILDKNVKGLSKSKSFKRAAIS